MPSTMEIQVTRTVQLYDKRCAACGEAFQGPANRKYCSDSCRSRVTMGRYYARRRQARQLERGEEPMPEKDKRCQSCDGIFQGITNARYCSPACREAAGAARRDRARVPA